MNDLNAYNIMKSFFLLLILVFLGGFPSLLRASRDEVSDGAIFTTKTEFWVYGIQGRLPYGKDTLYMMNSSRGGGIGGDKYKYVATLPAGTRLELVSLIKKSRRKYVYITRIVGSSPRLVEDASIAIFHLSMLKEPWRGTVTKTIRLDPDLFTDFSYPEK